MYFDNWYEMVRTTSTLNRWKDRNQNLTVLSLMNITWTLCRENPFVEELVWWQNAADQWNKKDGDEEENLVSQPFEQVCIFSSYLSCYTSLSKFLSTIQMISTGYFYISPHSLWQGTLRVTCTCSYSSLPFLPKEKPLTPQLFYYLKNNQIASPVFTEESLGISEKACCGFRTQVSKRCTILLVSRMWRVCDMVCNQVIMMVIFYRKKLLAPPPCS